MYKNKESRPILIKSFAVFLDLLGFSDDIILKNKSGESKEHLQSVYDAFSNASNTLDGYSLWQNKIFSDNILLGSPVSDPNIHS